MTDSYPFENRPLPYSYEALEPYINSLTMRLHHEKLLQAYIDRLNEALSSRPALQALSLEQLILAAPRLPASVGVPVGRNAGGVYNHRFFFEGMSPVPNQPQASLAAAINRCFGSFEHFKAKFKRTALSVFGSGYAWLVTDGCGRLSLVTTANQRTPLAPDTCPIITIDVWEHAYYLQYYNVRADYVEGWLHVADWQKALERYASFLCA